MNCRDVDKYLQAYVDDEFDSDTNRELEQHFKFCPVCQKRVEFELWFKKGFKNSIQNLKAPVGLRRNIRASLKVERSREIPTIVKIAPAFAILVVFLGIYFMPHIEVTAPIVEASVDKHVQELPFDVKNEDPKQLAEYFSKKIRHAVAIPRFRNRQLQLIGGRLIEVANNPTAYVAFKGNGRRYSLMAAPKIRQLPAVHEMMHKRIGNRDIVVTKHNGFNVAMWTTGQTLYTIVSDDAPDAMMQMAANAEYEF